jgi:hypothetical protein
MIAITDLSNLNHVLSTIRPAFPTDKEYQVAKAWWEGLAAKFPPGSIVRRTLRHRLLGVGGYACGTCSLPLWSMRAQALERIPHEDVLAVEAGGLFEPMAITWPKIVLLVGLSFVMGVILFDAAMSTFRGHWWSALAWLLSALSFGFVSPGAPTLLYFDFRWGHVYRCFACHPPSGWLDRLAVRYMDFNKRVQMSLFSG